MTAAVTLVFCVVDSQCGWVGLQDAHEFVRFLLDRLDWELRKVAPPLVPATGTDTASALSCIRGQFSGVLLSRVRCFWRCDRVCVCVIVRGCHRYAASAADASHRVPSGPAASVGSPPPSTTSSWT